ncbi:uncharacterized protein LOC112538466 [Tetranychus urticae]|uniref:uncharacterized protein LOC112538466 n=1 Tax=Tetranychus urticae TaxID=32264 RepID=UPI000D651218|nr:uncharacterized protein LOC112538466 [Tetranychus urticae]
MKSGKTLLCSTLTKALSKINSTQYIPVDVLDSNEDEKKTGSTINLSFAPINTGNSEVTLIDCPGRDILINPRITGLTIADLGVLVVSCDQDSLVDIIRKELALARHFNLREIVLFLNKSDLKFLDGNVHTNESIKKLLNQYGYQSDLIFSGSLLEPDADDQPQIKQLIDYIDKFPIPKRDSVSPVYMKVITTKVLDSSDTFVLGYLEKGTFSVGQNFTVLGKGREFDVCVSEILDSECDKIEAGSLWVVITNPGSYQANDHFNCSITPTSADDYFKESFGQNLPLDLYSDQPHSFCRVKALDYCKVDNMYNCNIKLSDAQVLSKNYPFVLAKNKILVGLGKVNEILPNLNAEDKLRMHKKLQ